MLSPRKLKIWGDASGILCGWVAPPNAPTDRLPLHVWFPFLRPGQYAVRWISEVPDFSKGRPQMFDIASNWTTFAIEAPPAGQHEEWLRNLFAHIPPNPGMLAGDYIPNLVAAAPNTRALNAIAVQLYSNNQVVAELAASALQIFPQKDVAALLTRLFHAQETNDVLARLVCVDSFRKQRAGLVADRLTFLSSGDDGRTAAAIEALDLLTHHPNDQTPDSAKLDAAADTAVLKAAPGLISSGNGEVTRQLAVYLGRLKSPEAHQLLWQIASGKGDSADQAHNALTAAVRDDLPERIDFVKAVGRTDGCPMRIFQVGSFLPLL